MGRRLISALLLIPLVGAALTSDGFFNGVCRRWGALALLAAFVLTATGLGAHSLERLNWKCWRRLEFACLSFVTGWALIGFLWLALASVKLWNVPLVVTVAAILFLGFGIGTDHRTTGWSVLRQLSVLRLARTLYRRPPHRIPAILTLAVIGLTFLWALGPVWDWDSEMYHLPNAQFLLEHGGLALSADEPLRNLPGQAYLWYSVGLMVGAPSFAALLMATATLVGSLLSACLAARWIGLHTAVWTPPVYWSGAIVAAIASTARVEPLYGLMFLATVTVLTPVLVRRRVIPGSGEQPSHALPEAVARQQISAEIATGIDRPTILLAGLFLGTAASVKYQGLYTWVLTAGWILAFVLRYRELRSVRMLRNTTLVFVLALTLSGPWWVKNVIGWGNPVYPMFARQASSAEVVTAGNSYGPQHTISTVAPLRDTLDLFLSPNSFSGPPNHFPHYLFLLLPSLLVVRRQNMVLGFVGLGLAYHLLAISLTHILRHTFPVFAFCSIGVAWVIARCETRWKMTLFLPTLVSLSLLFVLLLPVRIARMPLLLSYLGNVTGEEPFLEDISPGFHASLRWIDTHSAEDDRILMCWDARTFRLRHDAIIDPGGRTWAWLVREGDLNPRRLRRYLASRRIRYVLVNRGALRFNLPKDSAVASEQLRQFESERDDLVGSVLDEVYVDGPITVYRVVVE